jgi:hypothetical protein
MIVYEIRSAFNKEGNDKYAPLYPKDTDLALDLARWCHFGTTKRDSTRKFINPTRECWIKPYGEVWPKPGLEIEYEGKKKRGDCNRVGFTFLAYTHQAVELLGDYLDSTKGEFLPVVCSERDDLLIYRCMNLLDAIDEEKLEIIPSGLPPDPNARKNFKEHVDFEYFYFRENIIGDTSMFIVPSHLSTNTFVTDKFVQRVKNLKLKGFGFQPLWSSELGHLCDHCHNPLCPEGADINL